jgi:hypothetical protein
MTVIVMAALLGVTALALTSGGGVAGGAITTPPFALPDLGSLTLQTGSVNQVVRRDAANTVVATQAISAPNCAISPNYPLLAFATAKGVPGLTGGTIGDKTKGTGTDCGLVEAPNSLTLSLGTQTSTLAISSFALDIETRKNVRILMTASFHGATTSTYELRSGTSIIAGQGSSTAGAPIFNCNSQSSSNPNSGDRDNCRWSGNVLADKLVLQAPIGEFGLSGGADGGVSQPSVLKLTQFDGLLDCQSQPNNGDFDLTEGGNGTPQVGVVRKDNLNPNEPCQLIPVDLNATNDGGSPQVQFSKDLTSQTSAAFTMDVTWTLEGAQNPPPPTQFEFVDGQPLNLELCVGTPVYDANKNFSGIAELLDNDPSNDSVVPDQAASLPGVQYACYYHQETSLVANGGVQLFQRLYIVGDFVAHR